MYEKSFAKSDKVRVAEGNDRSRVGKRNGAGGAPVFRRRQAIDFIVAQDFRFRHWEYPSLVSMPCSSAYSKSSMSYMWMGTAFWITLS